MTRYAIIIALLFLAACASPAAPTPTPPPTPDPFAAFIEVHNDCALCGTDSVVGVWELESGDTMTLREDGTLLTTFEGEDFPGTWAMDNGQLCLYPQIGDSMCFTYEQKVDAMLLGGDSIFVRRDADAPARVVPTRAATTTQALDTGSGSGNEVGDDFTVPSGCGRQELSYQGTQTADSGGFVNFRVYDTTGFPGDSAVGPIDLDEEQSGAALWTLDAGTTYSIEITADGAEWSYTLKCR